MKSWPHAPPHWLVEPGMYMVTASTYWQLHAWVVLHEHYHFLAASPDDPRTLRRLINKLHMVTAKAFNREDGTPGRRVWFQYWETRITYQKSYLARLKYIHFNPVKHGLVDNPLNYPWSSARWFVQHASPAMVQVVERFKIDRVKVFEPI